MATVRAPLFSISASGSVGKLSFSELAQHRNAVKRMLGHTTTVRARARKPHAPVSQAQIAHRAAVKAAAKAWKALPQLTQAKWKAKGITVRVASRRGLAFRLLHGYALFLTEWFIQGITSPDLPLLPA